MSDPLFIRILRRASRRHYGLCKKLYVFELQRRFEELSGDPVLIYQMGKVGSSTVKRSLDRMTLPGPVYHVHFLTSNLIHQTELKRKPYFRTHKHSLLKRPWMYQFLRNQIEAGLDGRTWKIITMTRDPIARNISAFFENLEIVDLNGGDQFEIRSDIWDIDRRRVSLQDVEALTALFLDRFYHYDPMEFFNVEIKGVFGIDVYANGFDKNRGYQIYRTPGAEVLLIRMENLNEVAVEALTQFLEIDDLELSLDNISSQKNYAPLYRQFKTSVLLPESYIDQMYGSQYMRHFYSDEEIDRCRRHWSSAAIP